jgi:ABC-type glycerol-3-phosphate transport system substrate-binding protein
MVLNALATGSSLGTRRIVLGGLAGGAAGLLAACGAAGSTGAGEGSSPAARPAKIIARVGASPTLTSFFNGTLLPGYKAKAPQHTVEMEWIANAPIYETIAASAAAGTNPDAFWIGSDIMPSLVLNRLVRDLSGPIRTWGQEKDYYAGTIDPLWGKKWFLPGISSCDAYLYRTDLFAEAGLPADPARFPLTWEAFADAAVRLTRRDGGEIARAGFATSADSREWRQLFWQAGGEQWNADQTKVVFNDQAGVDSLTYLRDLLVKQQLAPPAGMKLPPGAASACAANLAAIQRVNPGGANRVRTSAPDVWASTAFGAPHKRTRQVSQIDVDGWAMPAGTKEPDAGFAFIAFFEEPAMLLGYNEVEGFIPPRKSLASSPHVQQPHLRFFADVLDKHGHSYRLDTIHSPILKTMVEDAVGGGKSVKQSLDDAANEMNRGLAQLPAPPK